MRERSVDDLNGLKDADVKLIELAGKDYSDMMMAEELQISPNAVEKRWAKLRKLFGVHSRAAVLSRYYRESISKIEASIQAQLQLHDQIPIALYGFDTYRRIVYCNRAGGELMGSDPSELIGDQSVWKLATPGADRRVRIRAEFLRSLDDFDDHRTEVTRFDCSRVVVKWSSLARSVPIYPFHWWVMGQAIDGF